MQVFSKPVYDPVEFQRTSYSKSFVTDKHLCADLINSVIVGLKDGAMRVYLVTPNYENFMLEHHKFNSPYANYSDIIKIGTSLVTNYSTETINRMPILEILKLIVTAMPISGDTIVYKLYRDFLINVSYNFASSIRFTDFHFSTEDQKMIAKMKIKAKNKIDNISFLVSQKYRDRNSEKQQADKLKLEVNNQANFSSEQTATFSPEQNNDPGLNCCGRKRKLEIFDNVLLYNQANSCDYDGKNIIAHTNEGHKLEFVKICCDDKTDISHRDLIENYFDPMQKSIDDELLTGCKVIPTCPEDYVFYPVHRIESILNKVNRADISGSVVLECTHHKFSRYRFDFVQRFNGDNRDTILSAEFSSLFSFEFCEIDITKTGSKSGHKLSIQDPEARKDCDLKFRNTNLICTYYTIISTIFESYPNLEISTCNVDTLEILKPIINIADILTNVDYEVYGYFLVHLIYRERHERKSGIFNIEDLKAPHKIQLTFVATSIKIIEVPRYFNCVCLNFDQHRENNKNTHSKIINYKINQRYCNLIYHRTIKKIKEIESKQNSIHFPKLKMIESVEQFSLKHNGVVSYDLSNSGLKLSGFNLMINQQKNNPVNPTDQVKLI